MLHSDVFEYLDLSAQPAADKTILQDGYTRMTTQEVCQAALRIGKCLMEQGLHGQPVAVLAAHRVETVICYLGILASGNYYIPLAPDIKAERFEKIRIMTGFDVLLGNKDLQPQQCTPEPGFTYLSYEGTQQTVLQAEDVDALRQRRKDLPPETPMYVIFTSGSTGEPKGIIKTHESMISFLDAYIREFDFRESDRLANQTPFYFDASAKDIFLALKIKCRLHILEEVWFVRPLQLAQYLNDQQITVIQWVPSALSMLSRFRVFDQVSLPYLRMVLFVGEVFPVQQLRIWMEHVPDAEFVNLYGASEIAGVCACYRIGHLAQGQTAVPIGYAMQNCELYLVEDGHLVTGSGQTGELYIKSRAVAAGYLQDAGRTQDVFVRRPLPQLPEGIYYRSGDLARYGENGELIFLSRKDGQIKHMGHRIELGEIESAAQEMEQVKNSCCLFERQKLILFYEGDCTKAEVSRYLKARLASYMLPNKLVQMEQWPLNANGKTDRMKLRKEICNKTGGYHG